LLPAPTKQFDLQCESAIQITKDDTTSSATGKGACSGHGGIQKATNAKSAVASAPAPAAATPAAPAAKSPPVTTKSAPTAATSNTDPNGGTVKCKDGTYSKSQHRSGTCSSHGGVAEWLTTSQQRRREF